VLQIATLSSGSAILFFHSQASRLTYFGDGPKLLTFNTEKPLAQHTTELQHSNGACLGHRAGTLIMEKLLD